MNIYGQTEQSGLAITAPIDEERRYGSLGKPLEQVVRWQIVPADAYPLIAEGTVIGTPHERFSEQVTAIVVPSRPGVTAADIAAYCEFLPDLRGLLRPRRIEIVDAIPRTGTNKIDKPTPRARFAV